MKALISAASLVAILQVTAPAAEPDWVTYPGGDGPGKGKHIVLIAGDEEYLSLIHI